VHDDDVGEPAVVRDVAEELLEGVEAARRGADADDDDLGLLGRSAEARAGLGLAPPGGRLRIPPDRRAGPFPPPLPDSRDGFPFFLAKARVLAE
jgi:hypothetical protein